MRLPEGYKIETRLSQGSFGYNMAWLYGPDGKLIAQKLIHDDLYVNAARKAFRGLARIARADAKWGD